MGDGEAVPEKVKTMSKPNLEMARHYGNMRFAMFTVFTAISGALVFSVFDSAKTAFMLTDPQKTLISIAGIALAISSILAEFRVSALIAHYQQNAIVSEGYNLPGKYNCWRWIVFVIMIVPFVFSIIFWVMVFEGCITMNK